MSIRRKQSKPQLVLQDANGANAVAWQLLGKAGGGSNDLGPGHMTCHFSRGAASGRYQD